MSDVESDLEEIPELSASPSGHQARDHAHMPVGLNDIAQDDDRRAHHNALERKRRDHIKDSFSSLREVVPTLKGEKASRALILKKGAEYIHSMRARINEHNKDILELKRQNSLLETQVKIIESRLENTGSIRPSGFIPTAETIPQDDEPVAAASTPKRDSDQSNAVDADEPDAKRVKSAPPE